MLRVKDHHLRGYYKDSRMYNYMSGEYNEDSRKYYDISGVIDKGSRKYYDMSGDTDDEKREGSGKWKIKIGKWKTTEATEDTEKHGEKNGK